MASGAPVPDYGPCRRASGGGRGRVFYQRSFCRTATSGTARAAAGTTAFGRSSHRIETVRSVVIALAGFGVGVGLAELFGAANLGTAFAFGQIAFAITVVVLLLRA